MSIAVSYHALRSKLVRRPGVALGPLTTSPALTTSTTRTTKG